MSVPGIKLQVSDKLHLSWTDISDHCTTIANKIDAENDIIDSIITISRGGMIPGVILSRLLNVREVYSIGIRSYSDDEAYQNRVHAPVVYQDIKDISKKMKKEQDKTVLFVDDISDRGNTLRYILNNYNFKSRRMCTLYIKPTTGFIPRYYSHAVEDDMWVVFPWEGCKS